ncbi:transmembrane emp24 domain-containing protein 6-like isoform X2 [Anarrhichthys ocellatus]|uniref:transmembrane emp24 domain-containing protein 6-like isoform X2 n=1 Tax=Anarrhichthys ocellatus TaxID=433405 RepID=UPI0012EE326A|nr:transmembrane emp24 domain-containing protein 6-like isoform X2 [Anarrhichthys ocellatus]
MLVPVNHFRSLHTDLKPVPCREELLTLPDMLFRILCLFLVLVFLGPVHGGPLTDLHPNMTDQELFWGTDQYDFSVVLPAAGLQCFWHFAHRGERFYLSFMVQWVMGVGHDRHLSVTVNAPSSLLVSTVDDAKGQINFEAEETGFYQMCFNNFHNRFGTMQVFLSFGVYYDGYKDPATRQEEEKKKKQEVSKDLNNTLSFIEYCCCRMRLTKWRTTCSTCSATTASAA